MPAELKVAIEEAARSSGRSINAEIVHRLAQSIAFEKDATKFLHEAVDHRLAEALNDSKTYERILERLGEELEKAGRGGKPVLLIRPSRKKS